MSFYRGSVDSLMTLSIDYLVSHLSLYINKESASVIKFLPPHIKDRLLHKFTSCSVYWRKLNFKQALSLLIHANTKRIDFTSCHVDDEMLDIIKECKNIRRLYLMRIGAHSITPEGLLNLIPHIPLVNILTLASCPAVTDKVIEKLTEHCPNLSCLDISRCENVTDKSLEALAKLHNLLALTISNTKVSGQGVDILVKGNSGSKIKELRIADCSNITEQVLKNIADHCTGLEVLIFFNSLKPVDGSYFQLHELKQLKQLTYTIQW